MFSDMFPVMMVSMGTRRPTDWHRRAPTGNDEEYFYHLTYTHLTFIKTILMITSSGGGSGEE